MSTDRETFANFVGKVHDATAHLSHRTSALDLYRDARDVAEQRLPGPLGVAVAAVLAEAADLRQGGIRAGSLGASRVTLALAVAVLEIVPDNPKESR